MIQKGKGRLSTPDSALYYYCYLELEESIRTRSRDQNQRVRSDHAAHAVMTTTVLAMVLATVTTLHAGALEAMAVLGVEHFLLFGIQRGIEALDGVVALLHAGVPGGMPRISISLLFGS